jgi:hypothetical protein
MSSGNLKNSELVTLIIGDETSKFEEEERHCRQGMEPKPFRH